MSVKPHGQLPRALHWLRRTNRASQTTPAGSTRPASENPSTIRAPGPGRREKWPWWGLTLALVLSWAASLLLFPTNQLRTDVSYTFFKQQVAAGNVEQISAQADTVRGTFRDAVSY